MDTSLLDVLPEGRPYKYRPLDFSRNEIRLLQLPPSGAVAKKRSIHDTFDAKLLHFSLDGGLEYEALSYRWVVNQDTEKIAIDGHQLEVSKTLISAIHEWQSPKETKLVWVDAICIDQANNEERSEQVAKMRSIYSRAKLVVVWLAEGSETSSLAFSLVQELHNHLNEPSYFEDSLSDTRKAPQWECLIKLLRQEYWRRVWVIQEVNSARSLILRCGNNLLEWARLVEVQNQLLNDRYSFYRSWIDFRTGGPDVLRLPSSSASGSPDLLEMLNFFRFHLATDPRDKVYAITGLTKARDDNRMPIDYSQSVREVYVKVVEYILHSDLKLDVICGAFSKENKYQLPTWAPSWSEGDFALIPMMFNRAKFSASRSRPHEAKIIRGEHDVLRTRGFRVATVSALGEPTGITGMEDESLGRKTVEAVLRWYPLSFSYGSGELDEAFVKTIVCENYEPGIFDEASVLMILAGVAWYSRQIMPEVGIHQRLLSFPNLPVCSEGWVAAWVRIIHRIICGRRLFLSSQGSIGLCPEKYHDGDLIVILLGCAIPVLLRPYNGYYELVGDVYLHGYMYGRGVDELEEGKFELETFEIR